MSHPPRAADRRPRRTSSRLPQWNDAESPLSWLRARKGRSGRPLISAEQFLAGEKLRGDYERSCLATRVTQSWDLAVGAGGGTGPGEITDAALAARQRFHAALAAIGPELASIAVQVCCLAAGIEQAERLLDLPQRSGKAVLGLALNALARHYGFTRPERRAATSLGHWALTDYRPAIPASDS